MLSINDAISLYVISNSFLFLSICGFISQIKPVVLTAMQLLISMEYF